MDELNEINQVHFEHLIEKFGLPLHLIFKERISENITKFRNILDAFYPESQLHFAVKSNPCRGAIRTMSNLGIGVDVVSENELQATLEENIQSPAIICNGNSKSDYYLDQCLNHGLLNAVDNLSELELLDSKAKQKGEKARVLLRFTGMPLEGLTSDDQSTASYWTKFGFDFENAEKYFSIIHSFSNTSFEGISAHIGTQICDERGFIRLFEYLFTLMQTAKSTGLKVNFLNVGGGFPVSYICKEDWENLNVKFSRQLQGKSDLPDWVGWDNIPGGYNYLKGSAPTEKDSWQGKAYWSEYSGAEMLRYLLKDVRINGRTIPENLDDYGHPVLILEPGRALIGTAGITLAQVSWIKEVMGSKVITLDLGIVNHGTNLITPDIFPVEVLPAKNSDKEVFAFIAGRLCFTGDMISKIKVRFNRMPERGEVVAIHHTGAYCADHFASNSCGFSLPGKIAIAKNGDLEVWRKPQNFEDVFPTL